MLSGLDGDGCRLNFSPNFTPLHVDFIMIYTYINAYVNHALIYIEINP